MAAYEEIHALFTGESALRNRVQVAVIVAAEAIRSEDGATENHANRLIWAASAFENPTGMANRLLMAVLAANKDATVEQITGASDAAVQSNVNAAIDLFATGA